jgi:hypothetical protein
VLARRLHLDETHARPQEVDEASVLANLHLRTDRAAVAAVALQQVVEEGLSLRAFASVV